MHWCRRTFLNYFQSSLQLFESNNPVGGYLVSLAVLDKFASAKCPDLVPQLEKMGPKSLMASAGEPEVFYKTMEGIHMIRKVLDDYLFPRYAELGIATTTSSLDGLQCAVFYWEQEHIERINKEFKNQVTIPKQQDGWYVLFMGKPGYYQEDYQRLVGNDKEEILHILTQHLKIPKDEASWAFFREVPGSDISSSWLYGSEPRWRGLTITYHEASRTEEERREFVRELRACLQKEAEARRRGK